MKLRFVGLRSEMTVLLNVLRLVLRLALTLVNATADVYALQTMLLIFLSNFPRLWRLMTTFMGGRVR